MLALDALALNASDSRQGLGASVLTAEPLLPNCAEKTSFRTIWASTVEQCKEQTTIGVPDLCSGTDLAEKRCTKESGFISGRTPITFQSPLCPKDFYVLGHVALNGPVVFYP